MATFFAEVKKELEVMKERGMRVPKGAFDRLKSENESEYDNMEVSAAADLLIQLADL